MLEEVLRYLNNRFDRDPQGNYYGRKTGTFDILDGVLQVAGLKEGQYFWIEGSAFNDGLHRYLDISLDDEQFDGVVLALRIPPHIIKLSKRIADWNNEYHDTLSSPLKSESFGGYSYTKDDTVSNGAIAPWQAHFSGELRPYFRITREWL